jgi:molecular chaperone DnaK
MAYGLGIDVGTTFTGAALAYDTHVEMLPLGETALVAPSVVFAARDGRLLTGEAALRLAESEPGRAVHEFKRRLGDPIPIIVGDRRFSATELIAAVVRDVVARAVTVTGSKPAAVVLTCPAIWGPYRLEQFTEVPALAGLEGCRVVTEPEAAVAFYRTNRVPSRSELMAVYDLGGGTFDTAIMRADGDRIELVGNAEGVDGTGGVDFDQVVRWAGSTRRSRPTPRCWPGCGPTRSGRRRPCPATPW